VERSGITSKQRRKLTEFLFLVPTVLAFILVIIIPFILGIYYSFTDYDGVHAAANYIGLANYKTIFTEPGFLHSFLVTAKFTIFNVIAVNIVSFLLSLLVTSQVKGKNFYRAAYFVPNLIGGIVLGSIWQFIFNNILPGLGKNLGLAFLSSSFIANNKTVIGALVTVNTWQYAGYIMMIYVASIQGISRSVLEAAEVDGAPYPTVVRRILMPLMANAFTISLFLTLTNSFKMYDVNVSLTNGGPTALFMMKPVNASEFLALNIYNTAFKYSHMAQGQAKAVIFFVVLTVISLIQVSYNKSKEVEA
jgi:raffinose/stachyose/melibiose transport system permease protein